MPPATSHTCPFCDVIHGAGEVSMCFEDAEVVAFMAKLPWAGFGAGTEGGKAKPEIWKEQAKFQDLSEKMQAETVKLAAAAKSGNLDQLKAAFGPAAASCKACHDSFRSR